MASARRSRWEVDKLVNGEIIDCSNCLRVRDPVIIDDFASNPAEEDAALE
ncbi:hypothetical protein F444_08811 [Phytophthora nicotianae P1976]|uniref:Uncharacterized protein n=1 Tax=Phytophthora nicotianae P1976 TaxID=1317066 RepID=A0A081A9R3_PHYNI|nr:hypothetical protein F444_08811 [Phytophthora nicotianae P1976]